MKISETSKTVLILILATVVPIFITSYTLYRSQYCEDLVKEQTELVKRIKSDLSQTNYMFHSPSVSDVKTETFEGKFKVYNRPRGYDWNFEEEPSFIITKYTVTGSGVLMWCKKWSNGEVPIFIGNASEIQIYPAN